MKFDLEYNFVSESCVARPRTIRVVAFSEQDACLQLKFRQLKLGRKVKIHTATQVEGDTLYERYRFYRHL